jgi:hypothetical protein
MTVDAFRINMMAQQWKAGQVVIEFDVVIPRDFVVAIRAVISLGPFVHIVIGMAAVASCLRRHIKNGLNVTINALDFPVSTVKQVFRIPVMVEYCCCPLHRIVTIAAVLTVMSLVIVIVFMTRETTDIQLIRERFLAVTLAAFKLGMSKLKGKIRVPLMVEAGVIPSCWVVAVTAVVTAQSIVRIVFFMT